MTDYVIIGILLLIIGSAVFYIIKAKKNGARCIGCPMSGKCTAGSKNCSCNGQSDIK